MFSLIGPNGCRVRCANRIVCVVRTANPTFAFNPTHKGRYLSPRTYPHFRKAALMLRHIALFIVLLAPIAFSQEITSPTGVAHRFIAVDLETGKCAIIEPDGKISWQ